MTDLQIINKIEDIRLQGRDHGLTWVLEQLELIHIKWDKAHARKAREEKSTV